MSTVHGRRLLTAAMILALPQITLAAPPKLDYLFPAGAQRGTSIDVTAAGAFDRWPIMAHVEGKGVEVKPGKTKGKLAVTVDKDAGPGVYWVRLYDEEGASSARPFMVGLLPEMIEQEPNDDPKKPQAIDKPRVVVNGRLDKSGDVDTFAMKLKKGETLVASLEANRTLRSPMDGVLQILSADGFVLEQNDDYHDLDPQIAFAVPKDGTYLVRLFAFPAAPDSSVRFSGKDNYVYRLTLTTGPFVEYVFPLAIERSGGAATVDLVGWNLPADLVKFPVTPREGEDTIALFDPRIANPFYIRQERNPTAVTEATKTAPMMVKPPITITSRLERRGHIDAYQFEARKGQKLSIQIESRSLGFPLNAVLAVTDAAGKTLAQNKTVPLGTDPSLEFNPPRDGGYRLEMRDQAEEGGIRQVYRMRIAQVTPDFELKVAGDSFTLTATKPLEIPVTITRLGGFNEEIALSVEGIPKEVAVTGTSKGVTLQPSGKARFAGPIRIIGIAKDGSRHTARATIAAPGRVTESLWLTATNK